jgi:hypothetical protein
MPVNRAPKFCLLTALLLTCGCGGENAPAPPPPPVNSPAATRDLAAYEELVRSGSYEFAVTMGREVVRKYPGTPAAQAVQQSLADTEAKARAVIDQRRLTALWSYQTGTQASGRQSTASIYSSEPASEAERVRLIFRRHSEWGESAYIYAGGGGFVCKTPCRVSVRFDDAAAVAMAGEIPETGEPAIFIDDDKALLAKLAATKRLTFEATLKDRGPVSLVFETAGFDAAQFLPLPK